MNGHDETRAIGFAAVKLGTMLSLFLSFSSMMFSWQRILLSESLTASLKSTEKHQNAPQKKLYCKTINSFLLWATTQQLVRLLNNLNELWGGGGFLGESQKSRQH